MDTGWLHRAVYLARRGSCLLDPSRYGSRWHEVVIDRPVFLLGTQGGGLTILSRILRRHPDAVSVTGDCRYWSGADEIQSVLGPILPACLSGIRHKAPAAPELPSPRGWTYATDQLLPLYRNSADHSNPALARKFQQLLRWCIGRHAAHRPARLIDKSQVFTVKTTLVQSLLQGCQPIFVLVTRDPYVSCLRAATRIFPHDRPLSTRLQLAAEHWRNSMQTVLNDSHRLEHFHILRFEDFLCDPTRVVRRLCNQVGMNFRSDMMPASGQRIPLGTMRRDRWYPIRHNANEDYLRGALPQHVDLIASLCQSTAVQLDYDRPNATA